MVVLSPSFILGLVVLGYLLSFVLFAIVRIATGVSIQRIGYRSLRHIAYTPHDGIRIDLRGLGLHLHRPTFARPTWISLRLSELKVTVDLQTVAGGKDGAGLHGAASADGPSCEADTRAQTPIPSLKRESSQVSSRSQTWKRLTRLKESIKRLHGKIHWIRMVDVEVLNSSLIIKDIVTVQIGSLTMAVDTRRRTVDRGRLFRHKKASAGEQRPAEWMFVVKSVLFTPEKKESIEIIDICSLNVHGLLYKDLAGLRDASVSLKLGRIHVPYDDIRICQTRFERCQYAYGGPNSASEYKEISLTEVMEELDVPGSREAKIVQTVSDSKEFISSILRGIQEIQLAVSFIGLSKEVRSVQPAGSPLYLNFAMNEFGIDLFRLDQKSPAHRMYFSPRDIAHQALLAAISIAVSVDAGGGKPERLLYIPMATTTVKTTLPSKTVADSGGNDAADRNANMLFANLVVTSPSIDLDLKHMPIVLALLRNLTRPTHATDAGEQRHHLISRLLPKASVKFSVQEPVARIVLPTVEDAVHGTDDYDLLISSISSISLDLESSHSSTGDMHYGLTSNLRISSYQFYYQSTTGIRHNLLLSDALELKFHLSATPEVSVTVSGNLQTVSAHMVRPEISTGVHRIMQHLGRDAAHAALDRSPGDPKRPNILRRLPAWLVYAQFRGSNLGLQLAGIDPGVSMDTRGLAVRLESWTAEYKAQKDAVVDARPSTYRAFGGSVSGDDSPIGHKSSMTSRRDMVRTADGRRLAIHAQGFEGFVAQGIETWESEPFVSIPRLEVALSTSSDTRGSVFHINSHVKALYVDYSLYRYYALGVAHKVFKQAFMRINDSTAAAAERGDDHAPPSKASPEHRSASESITIDVKATFIQIKASLPADPRMMLQVYGLEAGRHRWTAPLFKSKTFRIYTQAPRVQNAWTRIASVRQSRMDFRESRRKVGREFLTENSIEIATDFIRLAVPHQLVLHKVFDNFANVLKATEQLRHRFKTGTDEYILQKLPEGPKRVPRISLRSRALLFELEDGSFDWKLGMIYRVGLKEQKQRLAREEAYRLKVRKLSDEAHRRESSRYRAQSSIPNARGRSKLSNPSVDGERSKSKDPRLRRHSSHSSDHRGRRMRYDPECISGLTGAAKVSAQDAWLNLQRHNAQSWRKRVTTAIRFQNNGMKEIRRMFRGGSDEHTECEKSEETIVAIPDRPGLMATLITDLHVILDKPSFPLNEYARFLHSVGKGMPFDMRYTLLIPMNLQINMGETRVTLRDYPLPLLHVPAIRSGQSPRLPSWSLRTDFVIAEEYQEAGSTKHVRVQVVPADRITLPDAVKKGFCVDVRRTISPVKTYSDVDITINTSNPTSFTWGTSYQPAIQDMMQIIEGFTKPQVDPSDRVGFWDKIRLICHSRVNVEWKGDGDVHLKLKGSRDPYIVTGHGAGFVMCWRDNVRWNVRQDDDPKKFMAVSSGEYVLAIPDYSHEARKGNHIATGDSSSMSSDASTLNSGNQKDNALFKKVVMKLSGKVRWLAGLVFERNIDSGGRSFGCIPHYEVALKTPDSAKADPDQVYDAFRGFRSEYIHLSIAVVAPVDRDWSVTNLKPSTGYNSVHMTPRFFTHFFDWWSLFSGIMSLPIRQGKLFPGIEKSSKKFGRHLATIKYNLLLSPLFISHIYKHKDAEDYKTDTVGATGLKLRIDSFMLDLHQRREEFSSQGRGRLKQVKTSAMRINQAQLDFISADIRAISASIAGTSPEDLKHATADDLAGFHDQTVASPNVSRFTIPDLDYLWIDMDDFVELDWILPAETHPKTKIMPLAFAPRFTYFRETDHSGTVSGDPGRSSSFGDEPTHFCIMSQDNDPHRVQSDLFRERIAIIQEQLDTHQRTLGEQELRVIRDGASDPSLKETYDLLCKQGEVLEEKKSFLESISATLSRRLNSINSLSSRAGSDVEQNTNGKRSNEPKGNVNEDSENAPLADFISDFNNRFIVHNVQLKWNNSLRNIILRYVHQVSQRRGFVYYMSRRAVKFILDIVDEQNRNKEKINNPTQQQAPTAYSSPATSYSFNDTDPDLDLEERIKEIINDGKSFVNAVDSDPDPSPKHASSHLGLDISEEFTPQNSYHVRLIAPQIQLQSEKNARAVLAVTAQGMQLKVVQIMDKTRIADDVSGLVQRRFSVDMDGVQFFVTSQKSLSKFVHLYSANRYGAPKGSVWPPWVPIEVNFDFKLNPFGWSRVVQKTSASLHYNKYNTLRLKYNDEVTKGESGQSHTQEDPESRIDHLWVEFPHIRAICDSTQYYAMYQIVLDLLLYSEPLEKVRSERLEKIMLAADFSDLTGAPEMVISLQERIRSLEEIKMHFQLHAGYLDRQGWQDRLVLERDLTSCEDELFFMMKAITTSQRKHDERSQTSQTNGLLRWYLSASEIVWHLMRDKNEPLMEIQLKHAAYERTDNSDGSNYNTMEISRIHGLNLLPNALYPEMLAPYFENGQSFADMKSQDIKMFKVQWYMLEAIAGIPVLDQFEVNLFPLKVQLEREIGVKLFEYIFPNNGDNNGPSPFMIKQKPAQIEEEDSDIDASTPTTPTSITHNHSESQTSTRAGSLELRLRPTMNLPSSSSSNIKACVSSSTESHRFKLFQNSYRSKSATRSQTSLTQSNRTVQRRRSGESLRSVARSTTDRSYTNLSSMNGNGADKHRRFGLHRANSKDHGAEKDKASDDLTQMMSRASNYMTLAYVKIPSVVLCLSYKGKGERNLEDVHDFVFRMPALEYRNKTWSNLDLALRLKKDVIRALISHTGAIIGNKFSHHRPNKNQQSRLREIANSSSLLPNTDHITNPLTRVSTVTDGRSGSRERPEAPHASFIAGWGTQIPRTHSEASSLTDMVSPRNTSDTPTPHANDASTSPSQDVADSRASTPTRAQEDRGDRPIAAGSSVQEQNQKGFLQNSFLKRMTNDGEKKRHRESHGTIGKGNGSVHKEGVDVDNEERSRRTGVIHLGKKILGSLN